MVDCIGVNLRFQTKAAAPDIGPAIFALMASVKEICCVKHYRRLIGLDHKLTAADRLYSDRCGIDLVLSMNDKGVVVATSYC